MTFWHSSHFRCIVSVVKLWYFVRIHQQDSHDVCNISENQFPCEPCPAEAAPALIATSPSSLPRVGCTKWSMHLRWREIYRSWLKSPTTYNMIAGHQPGRNHVCGCEGCGHRGLRHRQEGPRQAAGRLHRHQYVSGRVNRFKSFWVWDCEISIVLLTQTWRVRVM